MLMRNVLLWQSKKKGEFMQFSYGGHGVRYCVRGRLHRVQRRQWWCLSPSADGASCRKGVKEERTVRPQRGCCTRKLFTMLFCTSSSAEVKRRLRKTASCTRIKGSWGKKKKKKIMTDRVGHIPEARKMLSCKFGWVRPQVVTPPHN